MVELTQAEVLDTAPEVTVVRLDGDVTAAQRDDTVVLAAPRRREVITRRVGVEVRRTGAHSNVLKKHAPGDRVKIKLDRGGEELEIEATLKAR